MPSVVVRTRTFGRLCPAEHCRCCLPTEEWEIHLIGVVTWVRESRQYTLYQIRRRKNHEFRCRWETNPPFLQIMAWSTLKSLPQTHFRGRFGIVRPYRNLTASRKSLLWRANPSASIGKTVSQLEADLWVACSSILLRWSSDLSRISAINSFCCLLILLFTSRDRIFWLESVSGGIVNDCSHMSADKGSVMKLESSEQESAFLTGFIIPIPPCLGGNSSISLISSDISSPTSSGMSLVLSFFSSGAIKIMSFVVRMKYVQWLITPFVSAVYAAWGSDFAISDKTSNSPAHLLTLSLKDFSTCALLPITEPRCFVPSSDMFM